MKKLAYKMQPAGHEQPAPKRKYAENRNLRDAFEKYLASVAKTNFRLIYDQMCRDDLYLLAADLLKDLQVSVDDAHGLLLERGLNAEEKSYAGFFVSVIYNKSDLSDIVYDLDVEVCNLAYALPASKAFINKGSGHWGSGTKSSGIIVNYVEKAKYFTAGFAADGSIITYGGQASTGYWVGDFDEGEDFVDSVSLEVRLDDCLRIAGRYKDPEITDDLSITRDHYEHTRRVIKKEEISRIPELQEYTSILKSKFEQGRHDYRIAVETVRALGPKPNEKLRQDLLDILRRAGHDL